MSERALVEELRAALAARGVTKFRRDPSVWVGPRSLVAGTAAALPSEPLAHPLVEGEGGIAEAAAVVDGIVVQLDHTFALGTHPTVEEGRELFERLRELLPRWVEAGQTARQLAANTSAIGSARGFTSVQERYERGALALPLGRTACSEDRSLTRLLQRMTPALLRPALPVWRDHPAAQYRPFPGLWRVQPHFEKAGVGVKFSDVLVVDKIGAYWLGQPGDCPAPPSSVRLRPRATA